MPPISKFLLDREYFRGISTRSFKHENSPSRNFRAKEDMLSEEVRELLRKDLTKSVISLALFFLSLSRANFGLDNEDEDVYLENSQDAPAARLVAMSESIRRQEMWELIFMVADNAAALLCFTCSAILLIMTLFKGAQRMLGLFTITMMACLILASFCIVLADFSQWACGVRFKMVSAGCLLSILATIYILNMLRSNILIIFIDFNIINSLGDHSSTLNRR